MIEVTWTTRWFRKGQKTCPSWEAADFLTLQLWDKGARNVVCTALDGEKRPASIRAMMVGE